MKCGYCRRGGFKSIRGLKNHWRTTGCPVHRPVWAKVVEARKRGSSGRRILHAALPHLYPSTPMSEETKEQLHAIAEMRRARGVRRFRKAKAVMAFRDH